MARLPHPRTELPHPGDDSLFFGAVFAALAVATPFFAPDHVSSWGVAALVAIWVAAAWFCCPSRRYIAVDPAQRTARIYATKLLARWPLRTIKIGGTIMVRADIHPDDSARCFVLHLGEAAVWPQTLVCVVKATSATSADGPIGDVADLERIARWLSAATALVAQREDYVVQDGRWRFIKGHIEPLPEVVSTDQPPDQPPSS
ncbi:MAG TPA: hypothetical protein VJR58_25675 [Vineibacter sp.]|nr:hypothetical protein [Vineibacter sp.]